MAYGLTKSIDIEKSSTQFAYRADDTAFDLGNTFTIEAWATAESLPSDGGNHALVGKWQTSGDNRSYVFRLNNTGGNYTLQIVADADGAVGSSTIISSNSLTISTDTWYHFAVSVSSGTATFYQTGVAKGGNSGVATPFNGAAAIVVGAERQDGTDGWDGKISLVRIWKGVARSEAQIQANLCSVLGSTSGLSAEWTLNDTYNDNSGNSFTLTGLNTPSFVSSVPALCFIGFTIAETASLTESITNLRTRNFTISETATLTEAVSAMMGRVFGIIESVSLSESVTSLRTLLSNISESVGLTEVMARIRKKITNMSKTTAGPVTNKTKGSSSITNKSKS